MARHRAGHLPPVENLGPVAHGGLDAAGDIAILAGGLLLASGLPLMAIAIPSDGWQNRTPIWIWDDRLANSKTAVREILETAMFGPVCEALYLAADALFDQLCTAHMCAAGERDLCAITDGTGLLLSADPPYAAMALPDWLMGLFGPDGRAAEILPMARNSVAAILAHRGEPVSIH